MKQHPLYTRALQADARYSETIKSRTNGARDRWTMTASDECIPEIAAARREKIVADEAWLSYMRWDSNRPRCHFGECGAKHCNGCGVIISNLSVKESR